MRWLRRGTRSRPSCARRRCAPAAAYIFFAISAALNYFRLTAAGQVRLSSGLGHQRCSNQRDLPGRFALWSQADRDFKETALADVSKQLSVARAASERTVGEWQARSESKEAAVLTAKTNEIAGMQEQHARCGPP